MNLQEVLNNKIIICFKEERAIFLNLKKENPFLNFKLMDVKEVYERLSFYHDFNALVEIIHTKKVSLKTARQIVECLRFVDESNDYDGLLDLKNSLINKGYLVKKEYQKLILLKTPILLFNQENNKELQHLLSKNGIKFSSLLYKDLEIEEKSNLTLTKYKTTFEQFGDICNKICELLSSGVSPEDIAIRANYDELSYYFSIFEELFNLKFYYKKTKSLLIFKSVKNYIEKIFASKTFNVEVEHDEYIDKVLTYIDQFKLRELNFTFAYNLLIEILEAFKETEISKRGIFVTKDFTCSSRKYTFELDFNFDNYPRVSSDDGYYVDSIIEKFGMNPSYIKTQIDNDKKKVFLSYNNLILSVSSIKFSKEVFMSTYVKELGIKVEDYIKIKVLNYSKIASKLSYKFHKDSFKNSENAEMLNDLFAHVVNDDENFDYTFKHFIDAKNPLKKSSYTRVNDYYECPFKFYCKTVLELSNFASSSAIDLGKFAHEILEDVFKSDFDFEVSFEKALNSKETNYSENQKLFFIEVVKKYLFVIASYLASRYKEGRYIQTFSEKEVSLYVNDVRFTGFIDSILVSEENGEKFLTIIDYKTGATKFDPNVASYGLSLQLPMYSLFVSKDKLLSNYKVGGLFIQPLFKANEFFLKNTISETTIRNALKLEGVYEDDPDYLASIEKRLLVDNSTKSSFIKGKPFADGTIEAIKDLAESKILEFTENAKMFNYDIYPYKLSGSQKLDGCTYCDFRNICYRNGKSIRLIDKKKGADSNEVE